MKLMFMSIMVGFLVIGCTESQRVKSFGGEMTVDLPAGKKFLNATWKEGINLWYITRDRRSDEPIETYEFREQSNFGVVEGVVKFKEH